MRKFDVFTKWESKHSFVIASLIVYIFSRLLYLTRLPMFTDEAVHIWWAERILKGDLLRSLNVGKPLEPYFIVPGLLAGLNAFWWARFVHVLAGLLIIMMMFAMYRYTQSLRVTGFSAWFYIVLPYALFYDRIALTEVYLALSGVLVLWTTLKTLYTQKVIWGVLTGIALVLGFVAKMPIGIFFVSIPIALGVFFPPEDSQKFNIRTLLIIYAPIMFILLGVGGVALLRIRQGLSPGFGLGLVDAQASVSGSQHIFSRIILNVKTLCSWGMTYLTWPVFIFVVLSLIWGIWRGPNLYRVLALLVLAGIVPFVLVADRWWPRYLFFTAPFFCLLMGYVLEKALSVLQMYLKGTALKIAIVALLSCLMLFPALRSSKLILDPEHAYLPATVRDSYIEGSYAGYGYSEVVTWLSETQPNLLVCFYIADYVQLDTYLPHPHNFSVTQVHIDNGRSQSPSQRVMKLVALVEQHQEIYLLLNRPEDMTLLQEHDIEMLQTISFSRSGGHSYINVYKLIKK